MGYGLNPDTKQCEREWSWPLGTRLVGCWHEDNGLNPNCHVQERNQSHVKIQEAWKTLKPRNLATTRSLCGTLIVIKDTQILFRSGKQRITPISSIGRAVWYAVQFVQCSVEPSRCGMVSVRVLFPITVYSRMVPHSSLSLCFILCHFRKQFLKIEL